MTRLADLTLGDLTRLRTRVEEELTGQASVQAAAQRFTDLLYDELEASAVLFRVFATIRHDRLPSRERAFVARLAGDRGFDSELRPDTTTVTLLGSTGKQAAWNDRYQSRHHLAIPLVTTSFIKTIPMVSRLMSDMGTGLPWVERQETNIVVKSMGTMARLLYVDDAGKAETADGFKIVPDQAFVEAHGVRTVVGLAGAYLDRTVVTILLFTNELVPLDKVSKFMPLVNGFKVATMKRVKEGAWF